ncbi:hypothetical protein TNCV_4096341 [Trichonephila clavipes]|nr:hypothetical protein TNCV_4096341 [Trichonephila clavipes]
MAGNSMSAADKDPSPLDRIVTGDEKWRFFIRPEILKSIGILETPLSPRRRFQSADEVKNASQVELKDRAQNGFQKYFNDKRWQMSIVVQGSYFEGGCGSHTHTHTAI